MKKELLTLKSYNDKTFMLCWLYTPLNYYRTFIFNESNREPKIDILSILKSSLLYFVKKKKIV